MYRNKFAFTLPEVLMTLLVLGVVVAFTIPIVVQNSYGRETVLKVRKAYSILSNSYENASTKYGGISEWDTVSSASYGAKMANSILLGTNCGTASNLTTNNDCMPGCPKIYKANGGSLEVCTSSDVAKLMAADGISYAFQIEDSNCGIDITDNAANAPINLKHICGTAIADIYHSKAGKNKNLYGSDIFLFYITSDGVIPAGIDLDKKYPYKASDCVKRITKDAFGCAAKLVYDKEKNDV